MNTTTIRLLAGAALCAASSTAFAQTSEYYVLSGDQGRFSVIQGGVVIRSWPFTPGTAQYQYPIVVRDTIRTMGADEGDVGGEYDLFGGDLGARYTHPAGPSRAWDGATDGTDFFTIDSSGRVWRLDDTWQNPVLLFSAGGIGSLTYDPTDDTMWVSQFGNSIVTNRTLTGSIIRQFDTGHTQNALAGEFKFGGPLPCYPDCDTSTGPGVLDIFDFLCFGNRFSAGDPYACDCDTSTGPGVCDIFDFLCFGNAFNAGCP